jgi:LacI family transcriptional regulator
MPTIRDVAKLAGVAPITVSRVVNNTGYISEPTRKRVKAAIKRLGYVPNSLARSLRSRRTGMLALIVTDITNPFFTLIARGVEDTASDAGFCVIFCNTDESEVTEQEYVNLMLQKQVDGILLVPARSTASSLKLIQAQGTPLVVIDRRVPGVNVDTVRCDSEDGAYRLVQLLVKLGHRRIAALSGPQGVSTADDRVAGYERALAEAGPTPPPPLVYCGSYTYASGFELAKQMLAAQPQPTAIFAANNFIAMGAFKALQEAGVRVPEDIALVSFDDLPPAMVTSPFLTVVAQPAYEMGRVATNRLLAQLAGSKSWKETVLPTEMIVRTSSGPAREVAGDPITPS